MNIYIVKLLMALVCLNLGVLVIGNDIIPGEYIVQFRSDITSSQKNILLRGLSVGVELQVSGRLMVLVKTASTEDLTRFDLSPLVQRVEPNRVVHLVKPVEMKDAGKDGVPDLESSPREKIMQDECREQWSTPDEDVWHLVRTSHRNVTDYKAEPYLYLHAGEGVTIYIIDTGIDIDHPDMDGRANWGMTSSDLYPVEGHEDWHGHGTSVASLAAGITWGVAKNATLYSAKCLSAEGPGTTMGVIEAIVWCTEHHKNASSRGDKPRGIINMSLGSVEHSALMMDAIDDAHAAGLTVTAAAMNENGNASYYYPAGYENVISVGATDKNDTMATFSNWGCRVSINAPGVHTVSAWSNHAPWCVERNMTENCVISVSGTSMAAPIAAGVAARYISTSAMTDGEFSYYSENPTRVRDLLTSTALQDKVTYNTEDQATTVNRLVHKACGAIEYDPGQAYKPCPFSPPPDQPITTSGPENPDPSRAGLMRGSNIFLILNVAVFSFSISP